MKNVIFYFSGTGNTYWAAKMIAGNIGNCELIDIARFDISQKIKAERVGIFYPVYYWGLPNIIKRFAQKAEIESQYIFDLHTMGGYDGVATKQLDKLLHEHSLKLSASYRLKMPNNIALISKNNLMTDVYRVPDDKSINRMIIAARKKLSVFSDKILEKQPHKNVDLFIAWHKYGYHLNEQESAKFSKKGEIFSATLEGSCIGCGKCSAACSVDNITMISGKPVWGDKCEFCLACLHACPQKAINFGYSKGKRRYTFPDTNEK
ncbi:MAG: EFR1 family ferrodoxin [Oscillospiraceae bacterium]|nr:EFR1 family ferrodoxin [Oscillospiraceae bacterium]